MFFVDLFLDKNATDITNGVPDLQLSYLIFPKMSTNVFSSYTYAYSVYS